MPGPSPAGLARDASHTVGDLFAVALIDAAIIGAAAVGLATAYATSDVLNLNHPPHRPVRQAKGFYACYAVLIGLAAALVLTPHVPLGLLTKGSRSSPVSCSRVPASSCCCCATTMRCSGRG